MILLEKIYNLGKIIDKYKVYTTYQVPAGNQYSMVFDIFIIEKDNKLKYYVSEPYDESLIRTARDIVNKILDKIIYSEYFFEDPVSYILSEYDRLVKKKFRDKIFYNSLKNVVKYVIAKDVIGYRSITPLLSDENIEDISLSSPNSYLLVWHKKYNYFGWLLTNIYIDSDEVNRLISKLAFRSGKSINLLNPVLEGVLPENYRVAATWMREVSPKGSSFTIRKFKSKPYTITELIKNGLLPTYLAAFLWYLIDNKKFIMIIGPSGAGKTTLLNTLLLFIPDTKRIISIEEVPEIYLYDHKGWKPLTTRWDRDTLDEILNLLKYALRERADYIVLGESRGLEARLVFQAASTGHGCITTFHASTLKELYARLRSKPISLDAAMFKLLDTVLILKIIEGENRHYRKVIRVYRNLIGKWKLIYKLGREDSINWDMILKTVPTEDINNILKRKSFLEHLIKIKAFDIEEYKHRLHLYYSGGYRWINGRWTLKIGVSNEE